MTLALPRIDDRKAKIIVFALDQSRTYVLKFRKNQDGKYREPSNISRLVILASQEYPCMFSFRLGYFLGDDKPGIGIIVAGIVACITWIIFRLWISLSSKLPYPPGPPIRGLDFLSGNLSDVPTSQSWLTYTEWKKTYGDIVHLRIYSQHTIILNSIKVIEDLLEKRPKIYSDRPRIAMTELMEWQSFNSGLMPYGDLWRSHRRVYQQSFRVDTSRSYRPIQMQKISEMLHNLLTTPDDFRNHFKTMASASIISTVYGYDIKPIGDPFVTISEIAMDKLSGSMFPGARAVNAFPILKNLPTWFPGAGFHAYAAEARDLTRQMRNLPFDIVKTAMAAGTVVPSIVSGYLSENRTHTVDHQVLKDVAATSYAAGSDTTASVIGTFFMAMGMFPHIQRKAQEDIDLLTEGYRLVTLDDRGSLPYIEAVFREVLRWRPVLPLSVNRCAYTEDVYEGHYIPKGTIVLTNIWALSHDPEKYYKPDDFDPDRFFDENGNLNDDDDLYVFGFGRRICPGRHFASDTVWLSMAAILSAFNIAPKKDADGNDIPFSGAYTDGVISHPLPFELSITPRSAQAEQLILDAVAR